MNKIIKIAVNIILIILLVSAFVCIYISGLGFKAKIKNNKTYREMAKKFHIKAGNGRNKEDLIDFNRLRDINVNVNLWIKIPKTNIDYPIIQPLDNTFYLQHDIENNYSQYGAIFADCRQGGLLLEKNLIIYGHNMGKGCNEMFSSLTEYMDNSYYKEHRDIWIYERGKKKIYTVVCVRETIVASEAYKIKFKDTDDFQTWLKGSIKYSAVKCDRVDADKIENVITLSTCNDSGNKRIIIVCAVCI